MVLYRKTKKGVVIMAKKSVEEKQQTQEELKALVNVFKSMPIDEWSKYIEKNAPEEKDKKLNRKYRACAKKSLSIKNMKEYILAHDNKPESKRAFKEASYGTYTNKDGQEVNKQSVVYASKYFVNTYLDGLLIFDDKKEKAFDAIADW